ncbi:chitin synthase-domain-containing protein [Lipomyces japonicus]|uniref:chitin synthase-domain-containing protein n=1 Tax=Lipomyces japonicus TaxID=56871 RepID=UPI0034CD1830
MPPVADVSQLSETALSDHAITAHLGARFHNGMPISTVSTNALVAINTFSSPETSDVVALAARAYDRLLRRSENQLIVFVGESGTGKSELRNHLCSRLHLTALEALGKKVSCAFYLFSALTTTKTTLTPVASKAGLLLEYQYNADASMIGAKFITYRLDRDRVAKVPTGERNFHVFYYLLAGTTSKEKDHLALDADTRYRYLGHPTQLKIGIDDEDGFRHFKTALKLLDFSGIEIAQICQVLAAIIHIGQLEFSPVGVDTVSDENHATVKSRYELEIIAAFLGVRQDDLEAALVYKTQSLRKERVTLVLDTAGARAHADDLARTIYSVLQSWIMEAVNDRLSQHPSLISNTISVVDFPGFVPQMVGISTTSGSDALNQLLYNSANEAIFNFMQESYFGRLEDKFDAEDIQVPLTEYFDNSDTVKLLTKPQTGILALLDDNTRRGKSSHSVLETMFKRFDKNPALGLSPVSKTFAIKHYNGEIDYSVDRLLEANTDDISGDLMNLFSSTNSEFIRSLFSTKAVTSIKHPRERTAVLKGQLSSKPLRQPSILRRPANPTVEKEPKAYSATGEFNIALETMISSFQQSNPYFVFCIKPNDRRIASQFDVKCVRQQLHSLGIADIAKRVQTTDVSVFLSFAELFNLSGFDENSMLASSDIDRANQVFIEHFWTERDARVGTTGVFLSEAAWRELVDPNGTYMYVNEAGSGNPFSESKSRLLEVSANNRGSFIYGDDIAARSTDALTVGTGIGGQGDLFQNVDSREVMMEKGINIREEEIDEVTVTASRKWWMFFVWLVTFWLPDSFIKRLGRMSRKDVRIAWREKLAINLYIWFACVFTVLFIVGLPILICPTQHIFSVQELSAYNENDNPKKVYTAIRGEVFDLSKFAPGHYPSIVPQSSVLGYGGEDATKLFPVQVSALCQGVDGSVDPSVTLNFEGENTTDTNAIYHDFRYFRNDSRPDWYYEMMIMLRANYKKGNAAYSRKYINKLISDSGNVIGIINGDVYDLTSYIAGGRQILVPPNTERPKNVNTNFMDDTVISLFQSQNGQDITKYWENLSMESALKNRMHTCLRNLFYVGRYDTRNSPRCQFARYFLLAISLFLVSVILVKFLAALQFSKKNVPENIDKFIICQVPAYTEDEDSLRRAIDSLARMKYDDKRKLLFIICDGMIVGAGNDRPTPRIVLDILGVSPDIDPEPMSFESLGEGQKQHNMGKVYSGLYEVAGHIVPFVVVVKVGKPAEISRPGNRGKRDSQLILMRFLNRVHFNAPMNPLELELYHQIRNVIGVSPTFYEYILQVDADTEVAPDSATRMVTAFLHDTKIIALCGETSLANARKSIVTMIQVYEYYISHNLSKAFESLFGSITCLPGCFSMFRIRAANSGKPLFVSNSVVQGYAEIRVDTLHMKNLLHLGEDRYLTTLLLRHHPTFKTKFIRDAMCMTIAPDSWKIFLSQRRRWINSTIHNLIELVPMSQLCGFCCFSMRFVVLLDLMATIVQPVTVGYLVYLFYKIAVDSSVIPVTSIIILVSVYGLQAIIFILRRRWEMIGWMFFYILAIPVFSLGLPFYSFWHMDDFSWGNTRLVFGEKGKMVVVSDEGKFDPGSIPKKKWEDFQAELWEQYESQTVIDSKSEYDSRPRSFYPQSEFTTLDPSVRSHSPSASVIAAAQAQHRRSVVASPGLELAHRSITPFQQASAVTRSGDVEMGTIMLPSEDMLLHEIREIIRTSDLMTVTKKAIRHELERRFGGVSLDSKRSYINSAIEAILAGEL